jgi:GNAT superfamily N-acetyltransferase
VTLPASFGQCLPVLESYEGEGWFRRRFVVPADWRGRRVALRFAAVNYRAAVWVNGEPVGEHADGFLPFEFEAQRLLRWGEENLIAVRADNVRRPGEVPGLQRGWLPEGGVLREVSLVATDALHLEHVTVTAAPSAQGGALSLRVELRNGRPVPARVAVAARLTRDGRESARFTSAAQECGGGQSALLSLDGVAPGVAPWSPEHPNLYDLRVELTDAGAPVDALTVRVGFRRIEAREGRLWLNERPLFLAGFNRHEDSPRTGMCPDMETTRRDLVDMKSTGANFVRLCHYPHHPGELDLCDELGLLVMGEIPLFWWDGLAEGEENYARKLAAAERQLRAMVRRDVNHPSVVLWSVSNETHEQRPEVAAGNATLVKLARALDPMRLAVHVSNRWRAGQSARYGAQYEADAAAVAGGGAETQFREDDVICVNAYPTLNRRGYAGERDYDPALSTQFWREELARLSGKYPGKPILVAEFGHASFEGVHQGAFSEEAQAETLTREFAGMDAPYVCGAVVWCWADHPWPQTGFCRNLRTSPYGVVTRERRKLKACATLRDLFRARRAGESVPYHDVRMVRPDLEGIPDAALPDGFRLVDYRPGDAAAWTDIHRLAYAGDPIEITPELHARQFGTDEAVLARRQLFIEAPDGRKIATATAWARESYHGEPHGQVHWVAALPAYQGRGLAKPLLRATLLRMKELGHARAMLVTQSTRKVAIRLYEQFGFAIDTRATPGAPPAQAESRTPPHADHP